MLDGKYIIYMYRIYMNYKLFKITPKYTIFISLIGVLLLIFLLKVSWSSEGIGMFDDKIEKINTNKMYFDRWLTPTNMDVVEKDISNSMLTKEGEDKLRALVIENDNMKDEFKIHADELFNTITNLQQVVETDTKSSNGYEKSIQDYEAKLKKEPTKAGVIVTQINTLQSKLGFAKEKQSKSEKELDTKIAEYNEIYNSFDNKLNSYFVKYTAIIKDYQKPYGVYVPP